VGKDIRRERAHESTDEGKQKPVHPSAKGHLRSDTSSERATDRPRRARSFSESGDEAWQAGATIEQRAGLRPARRRLGRAVGDHLTHGSFARIRGRVRAVDGSHELSRVGCVQLDVATSHADPSGNRDGHGFLQNQRVRLSENEGFQVSNASWIGRRDD
jgi:hypothetical protein